MKIKLNYKKNINFIKKTLILSCMGIYTISGTELEQDLKSPAMIKLSELDKNKLFNLNNTYKDYNLDTTIQYLFYEQVSKTPNNIALSFNGQHLTYNELNIKTNQLANYFIAIGLKKEDIIPVCLERSVSLIVSLLAIMKANGAYLPIDTHCPHDRAYYLAEDAKSSLIITNNKFTTKFTNCSGRIVNLDLDNDLIKNYSSDNLTNLYKPDDLAYVIYTSGSTGKPKGVLNVQRGLVNRLLWMQDTYRLTSQDKVLQKTPYNFDVSVWEFFWPLITGARLIVAPPDSHKDPLELAQIIQSNNITTMHFVPSMLSIFLDEPKAVGCKSLRQVFASGEALPYSLQEKFFNILPNTELHNLYGPTEAAIDVSYWQCIPNHYLKFVPIGKPIANIWLLILDENMQPKNDGSIGQLYIGGVGLARGYLNQPTLTQERFIKNPFSNITLDRLYDTGDLASYLSDGNIKYHGRIDSQVKISGIRIELGEIEQNINEYPGIKKVIVIAKKDSQDINRLICYLQLENQEEFNQDNLMEFLKSKLPSYEIPSIFKVIDVIPTTTNGKVDTKALPEIEASFINNSDYLSSPSNEIENKLCEIWEEILGIKNISVTATFNQMGGDSMRSIQVLQKMRQAGYFMSVTDFTKHLTIRTISEFLMINNQKNTIMTSNEEQLIVSEDIKNKLDSNCVDVYPVSSMQELIIKEYRSGAENQGYYHYQQCLSIYAKDFDLEVFVDAVKEQVLNNPNFSLYFMEDTDNNIYQVVRNFFTPAIECYDLQSIDESAQKISINTKVHDDRKNAFNPWDKNSSLSRFFVFTKDKDHFDFFMSIHHAIYDGWSNIEFLNVIFKHYINRKNNIAINYQKKINVHKEFIILEKEISKSLEAEIFWDKVVEEINIPSTIPLKLYNNPSESERVIPRLDHYISISLRKLNSVYREALSVTYKSVFLSAFIDSLSQLILSQKLTTGILVNGRSEKLSDPTKALGLFWNIVPFNAEMTEDKNEQVSKLNTKLTDMEPYNGYPLSKLQEKKGSDLFSSTFNFLNFHNYNNLNYDNLNITNTTFLDRFHYPFNFIVSLQPSKEMDNVFLRIEYDESNYSHDEMERFMQNYNKILKEKYLL